MYRIGHYGAALTTYAPLGMFVALAGYETVAIVGCVVSIWLSTLPDYDHYVPLIEHRGPTHTVPFALLVGAALAGATAVLVGASSPFLDVGFVGFAFAVGSLAIVSHLLADALTPAGIRPFWPLSRRRYSLAVTRASNTVANYLLFALGVLAIVVAAKGASVLP